MNSLPPEILHIILGHLPFPDLCQSHTLVCKEWRDIIQQEKVIEADFSVFFIMFFFSLEVYEMAEDVLQVPTG